MILPVKCPYCGTENGVFAEIENGEVRQVVTCETELGGCEQPFAVFTKIEIKIEGLAIEGFKKIEDMDLIGTYDPTVLDDLAFDGARETRIF